MIPSRLPQCIFCIHVNPRNWFVCPAFPDGVPEDIYYNRVDHRQPFNGDNGIHFEPKDQQAAEYVEQTHILMKRGSHD
jgi:hypothetical protein